MDKKNSVIHALSFTHTAQSGPRWRHPRHQNPMQVIHCIQWKLNWITMFRRTCCDGKSPKRISITTTLCISAIDKPLWAVDAQLPRYSNWSAMHVSSTHIYNPVNPLILFIFVRDNYCPRASYNIWLQIAMFIHLGDIPFRTKHLLNSLVGIIIIIQ